MMRTGTTQYTILEFLHRSGPVTAREITEELARSAPIAHSTVQTLLRQLEAKGLVAHEEKDRAFVFRALRAPEEMASNPLRDVLTRVYQGSVYSLVSQLLRQETVSAEEVARLRCLLDQGEEKS
ncbi:MAG: BlaI/MecI/CopY family transcriptional regulator [Akkermansiaceae bacterium]|nr:BlaI/MecI/CopY family transcriptional regulator [Armatimonadota bacterium]